jgi:hypothetical protein
MLILAPLQAAFASYAYSISPFSVNVNFGGSSPSGGKVGYWDFSKQNNIGYNFSDGTSITSHNVTTVDTTLPNGESATAISLNGTSSYLQGSIRNLPSGDSPYSIGAWINTSSPGANGIVGWGSYGATSEVNAFRTGTACPNGSLVNYSWAQDFETCNASTIYDGNWHYVMATYDGSSRAIYVDGLTVGSIPTSGLNVTSTELSIGTTFYTEYFHGLIAQVSIYNRALAQSEIAELYNGTELVVSSDASGSAILPTAPTQSGMTFAGWYGDPSGLKFLGIAGGLLSSDSAVSTIFAIYSKPTPCASSTHLLNGSFETITAGSWTGYPTPGSGTPNQIGDFDLSDPAIASTFCWGTSESDNQIELQRQANPSNAGDNTGTATYPFLPASEDDSNPPSSNTSSINRLDHNNQRSGQAIYDAAAAIPAQGNYYAEINANQPGMLFQDITTVPGEVLVWSLSHKGRNDPIIPDLMHVEIGNAATETLNYYSQQILDSQNIVGNSPESFPSDPYTSIPRQPGFTEAWSREDSSTVDNGLVTLIGKVSQLQPGLNANITAPNADVWGQYSGVYVVPAGQYLTRFGFVSDSPNSVGNLIDDISLVQQQSITWNPGTILLSSSNSADVGGATDINSVPIDYTITGSNTSNCSLVGSVLSWQFSGTCSVQASAAATADLSYAAKVMIFTTNAPASPTKTILEASSAEIANSGTIAIGQAITETATVSLASDDSTLQSGSGNVEFKYQNPYGVWTTISGCENVAVVGRYATCTWSPRESLLGTQYLRLYADFIPSSSVYYLASDDATGEYQHPIFFQETRTTASLALSSVNLSSTHNLLSGESVVATAQVTDATNNPINSTGATIRFDFIDSRGVVQQVPGCLSVAIASGVATCSFTPTGAGIYANGPFTFYATVIQNATSYKPSADHTSAIDLVSRTPPPPPYAPPAPEPTPTPSASSTPSASPTPTPKPTPSPTPQTTIQIPTDQTKPVVIIEPKTDTKSPTKKTKPKRKITVAKTRVKTVIKIAPRQVETQPEIAVGSSDIAIQGLAKGQRIRVKIVDLNGKSEIVTPKNDAELSSIVNKNPHSAVTIVITPTLDSSLKKGAQIAIDGAKKNQHVRVTVK